MTDKKMQEPEGWKLIKVSRLEEIVRLAKDPSEGCYRGRGLYDDHQVHANWNMCSSHLDQIRDEILAATEWGHDADELAAMLTTPPAQPAVPDAIADSGENPDYRAGWNECRETMLEMMK